MEKQELINIIAQREPLLANAVSHMVDYVAEKFPPAFPSREQTDAVNTYLDDVMGYDTSAMTDMTKEHRRLASQKITIAAIRVLDKVHLDRLQDVLDHIAYDRDYCMPDKTIGYGRH